MMAGDHPDVYVQQGEIDGIQYLEVILGHVDHPDVPLPLVVIFHGRGGKPEIPSNYMDFTEPVRFFIPQAPDPLGDGYTWLATWSLSPRKRLFQRSLLQRVDQLSVVIDTFVTTRPTRGRPIVTGFSQGGILSWTLAVRHPDQFSAAFPMAAWIPDDLIVAPNNDLIVAPADDIELASQGTDITAENSSSPATGSAPPYPLIHALHGANDEVVPVDFGRQTKNRLQAAGWDLNWTEFEGVGHEVSPEMRDKMRELLQAINDQLL
jgi:phospholipase/carboxylesterase